MVQASTDTEEDAVKASITPHFGETWSRNWDIKSGQTYHIRVVIRQPRVEVYIDDLLVLHFSKKFAESLQRRVGLFVDRVTTRLINLAIYALKSDQSNKGA